MKNKKLDEIFKEYYLDYKTYDGLEFEIGREVYRVEDTRRTLQIFNGKNKSVFRARIPYVGLFKKIEDAVTPSIDAYQNFQNSVVKEGKGTLQISSFKFDLHKEKDSIIIKREDGIEIVFDNIANALCHVRKVLRDKLDVRISDAEYNKGDKLILGVDDAGKEKVGTVTDIDGDKIVLDVEGAEIRTSAEDLNDQIEEQIEEAIEDGEEGGSDLEFESLVVDHVDGYYVIHDGDDIKHVAESKEAANEIMAEYEINDAFWNKKKKKETKPEEKKTSKLENKDIGDLESAVKYLNKKYRPYYGDLMFSAGITGEGKAAIKLQEFEEEKNAYKDIKKWSWSAEDVKSLGWEDFYDAIEGEAQSLGLVDVGGKKQRDSRKENLIDEIESNTIFYVLADEGDTLVIADSYNEDEITLDIRGKTVKEIMDEVYSLE
jgi:hypothetical protein